MPGAVPAAAAAAMEDEVWAYLDRRGVVRDRPETWPAGAVTGLRAVTAAAPFAALGSPAIRAALDDLLGRWEQPRRWGRLLVTFPDRGRAWSPPPEAAWHNDFVPLRPEPGLRAVQIFWILRHLPAHGGGTLVLAGSHHRVGRYIEESGEAPHPRRVRAAVMDGARDLSVVELTGRAGDAFVMHCDTLHAVSANTQDGPRMMATTIVLTPGR